MKKIFLLTAVFVVIFAHAQEFSSFTPDLYTKDTNYGAFNFFHLKYFNGDHMTYPKGFENAFANGYHAFEARVGWQSFGRHEWQRIHNNPVYGLGVFASSLGKADVDSLVGSPSGIYFFYEEPLVRWGNFTAFFDLAIGLSYDFNPYNAENNPTNDVIGSRVNLYFNGGLDFMYGISERLDLSLGLNFFHFSNGRTNTPQRGINLAGWNIGARYNFNAMTPYKKMVDPNYKPQIRPTFITTPVPEVQRFGEVSVMAALGTVETEPGEAKYPDGTKLNADSVKTPQKRYSTSTIAVDYAYKVAHRLKLQVGFDFMFDGSNENFVDDKTKPSEATTADKILLGYHFGFQYLIERFAFYYGLGDYVHNNTTGKRGDWYMRVGGRIGITEDIDAHIALKTRNGGIADWIEWGVAYKFKVHD